MQRYDIINYLIQKNGYTSYLEIGLDTASNFRRVRCQHKESCEPFPVEGTEDEVTYRMTSDEMFATVPSDKKWDIVFIDGLHQAEVAIRDIVNSLKHLNKGGKVVVHDCLPASEINTSREYNPEIGVWTGDVYKAMMALGTKGLKFYTIHTDMGVGVIDYCDFANELEYFEPANVDFGYYYQTWMNTLNVVSEQEFEEREGNCFKQHILLLLGLTRPQNFDAIIDSVLRAGEHNKNANLYILVCFSPKITEEERESVAQKLFKTKALFTLYNVGEEGYGGVIYNNALKDFRERYLKTMDPWVYILDDDNLLCNRAIEKALFVSKYFPLCKSVRLNGADDCGNISTNEEYHTFDPSYVLIKYSLLEENGFYGSGPAYDVKSIDPMLGRDRTGTVDTSVNYSATHNAIVPPEKFKDLEEFLKTQECTGMFRVQSNCGDNEFNNLSHFWKGKSIGFQIDDNETIQAILDVIKGYYRKKNLL